MTPATKIRLLIDNTWNKVWSVIKDHTFTVSVKNQIEIPENESYAANCIWVNESVIIPLGYPTVKQRIMNAGYTVIETDVSEFEKLDGGLSCLSLRY